MPEDAMVAAGVWYPISDQGVFSESGNLEEKAAHIHRVIRTGLKRRSGLKMIILSHEGLLVNAQWPTALRALTDDLKLSPLVVCYLRRQDIWLESAWKQWGAKHEAFPTIQDYLNVALPNLDLMAQLRPWLDTFGRSNMLVRRFEKREIGDDILPDFLSVTGSGLQTPTTESGKLPIQSNRGLRPDVLALLSLLKTDKLHDNSLLDLFEESLGEAFKKQDPFESYGLLSIAERQRILKYCETSNRTVSELFFNGEWPLFKSINYDTIEPKHSNYHIADPSSIRILLEILRNQHQRILNLERQLRGEYSE